MLFQLHITEPHILIKHRQLCRKNVQPKVSSARVIYHMSKYICVCVGTCVCNCKPLLKGPAFVENTIDNSPKVSRAKFLGSHEIFCFISICKFGSFKGPFAMVTSLSELFFRFRRFILLVQMKKVISMNCAGA